mmetsp:Transcript_24259/g.50316  ORF Transcript_24259/g.50316 Transcript_24259/m.50316 type:complete len:284 (+) Transcript_24259:4144-4995(+)
MELFNPPFPLRPPLPCVVSDPRRLRLISFRRVELGTSAQSSELTDPPPSTNTTGLGMPLILLPPLALPVLNKRGNESFGRGDGVMSKFRLCSDSVRWKLSLPMLLKLLVIPLLPPNLFFRFDSSGATTSCPYSLLRVLPLIMSSKFVILSASRARAFMLREVEHHDASNPKEYESSDCVPACLPLLPVLPMELGMLEVELSSSFRPDKLSASVENTRSFSSFSVSSRSGLMGLISLGRLVNEDRYPCASRDSSAFTMVVVDPSAWRSVFVSLDDDFLDAGIPN